MSQRTTRYGVSFEQVVAAAEALTAAGARPSLRAIRAQLGDTGSLSTIQRHMESWTHGRSPADNPQADPAVVEELKARLLAERRLSEQQRSELIRLRMRLDALATLEAKYSSLLQKYEAMKAEVESLRLLSKPWTEK